MYQRTDQLPRDHAPGQRDYSTTWLTQLQLMAVQPACLLSTAEIHGQHNQQQPGPLLQHPAAPASEQQHPEPVQHDLLLHLNASLTSERPCASSMSPQIAQLAWHADDNRHTSLLQGLGPACHDLGSDGPWPLPVQHTQLHLLVLSRQMQLLQRQQIDLLHLLQQQHKQQDSQHMASGHADGSSSSEEGHSRSISVNVHMDVTSQPTTMMLDCLHLVLMVSSTAGSRLADASSDGSATCKSATLTAAAAAASAGCSGAANTTNQVALAQQEGSTVAATAGATPPPVAPACIIADIPLLLLPAAAQQEVQQLLLPAMRQEVQAEQQQQQGRYGMQLHDHVAHECMMVEHGAWQHYCQLANDIHTVMELAIAAAEPSSSSSSSSSNDGAIAATESSDGNTNAVTVATPAGSRPPVVVFDDPAAAAAAAGYGGMPPVVALQHITQALLFPLLLPFLAVQGMYNTLHLLLLCLPQQLQQQWHQQQLSRLQQLAAAPPAPVQQLTTFEEYALQPKQQPQQAVQEQQGLALGLSQPLRVCGLAPALSPSYSRTLQHANAEGHAAAVQIAKDEGLAANNATVVSQPLSRHHPQQADLPSTCTAGCNPRKADSSSTGHCSGIDCDGNGKHALHPALLGKAATGADGGNRGQVVAPAAAAPAAVDGAGGWYLPLVGFRDAATEQSYLSWKQQSLLHLDYLSALFGLFYLAVLLRRMISQPTTLFYFSVILTKVLPYLPLMLGQRRFYLKHREFMMSLVAPTMALLVLLLTLSGWLQGQQVVLLPNKAYRSYWASRGELQTACMRAFTHHMRIKPCIACNFIDACVCIWVFSKVFSGSDVVVRACIANLVSTGLSWGLDWHMRRRFVQAVSLHQQVLLQAASTRRH